MRIRLFFLVTYILIWLGLIGFGYSAASVIFALLCPLLTALFAQRFAVEIHNITIKPKEAFCYFGWLVKEIWLSTIAVIKIVWRPHLAIYPVLEPIKSKQKKEIGIAVYANSITLTPGTVTLSAEGNVLLVHALDVSFMEGLKEGTMDKKVSEIWY